MTLDPGCQKVNHGPADLQAVRIEDVDSFFAQKLANLSEILPTARLAKGIDDIFSFYFHSGRLLHRKAPFAHMAH